MKDEIAAMLSSEAIAHSNPANWPNLRGAASSVCFFGGVLLSLRLTQVKNTPKLSGTVNGFELERSPKTVQLDGDMD